jgi:uncharacterized protein (TIGR02996 family)
MTDGDALLAAILASPDEDTPRLAYADWLDENDQPDRAALIRVQIELGRLPPNEAVPWNRHAAGLRAREQALLEDHRAEWLAPLRARGEPLQHPGTHGQFRRGFVEVVWMPAAVFVQRGERLLGLAPVRELRVTETTDDEFGELLRSPPLRRLEALDLSDRRLGDVVAVALIQPPDSGLRVFRLRGCGITDAGAHFMANEAFVPCNEVRELDVSHNPISEAGLAALRGRFGAAVHAAGTG